MVGVLITYYKRKAMLCMNNLWFIYTIKLYVLLPFP